MQDFHQLSRTPIRGQKNWENGQDVTPSRFGTPLHQSPYWTPGRQFINPFEIDPSNMHLPLFSPNLFKVTKTDTGSDHHEVIIGIVYNKLT